MTDDQVFEGLKSTYGVEITSGDVKAYCAMNNLSYPTVTRRLENFKTARGRWNLEVTQERVQEIERNFNNVSVLPEVHQNLIPDKDDTFVQFGNFKDIKRIIQSRLFYPTFITGLSGNGKTFGVEQVFNQASEKGNQLVQPKVSILESEIFVSEIGAMTLAASGVRQIGKLVVRTEAAAPGSTIGLQPVGLKAAGPLSPHSLDGHLA